MPNKFLILALIVGVILGSGIPLLVVYIPRTEAYEQKKSDNI